MDMSFSGLKARIGALELECEPDRRRHLRHTVDVDARVRALGSEGHEARLVDISPNGFQARSDGLFDVGARVWLMIPGRERANAVVRWIAGDRIGAEFVEPIRIDGPPFA